jgi:3-phenylpropionate/trans-cinnamate dioxygenase ferredoxin subunit
MIKGLLSHPFFLQERLSAPKIHPPQQGIIAVSEFFEAAFITEFREGTMKKIMVRGHAILLAMVKGHYYAVDTLCPHLEGDLSEGTLREATLTCPMHNSQFDMRDGHVIRWTDQTGIRLTLASQTHPPRPLKHYPVRVEGDKILIALERF